ncbi:hypothetical protein ACHAWT_002008 [Skeletonema menzelii]
MEIVDRTTGSAAAGIKKDDDDPSSPKKCVFIDNKNGASSLPPPPRLPSTILSNKGSTRALSRRNRVYVYREFLLSTFPLSKSSSDGAYNILDVAGGRGDLSWILNNIDGMNSIIADPRIPNHKSLIKSTEFLIAHPGEAAVRAVEGVPTHQPLAKLLPRLMERKTKNCVGQYDYLSSPFHLRIHVDDNLVKTVKSVLRSNEHHLQMEIWDEYWRKETCRIESNKVVYGGTSSTDQSHPQQEGNEGQQRKEQITDSRSAYDTIRSLDYIAGFHPDQATEAAIDLAIFLKIPWAVVPCCVFPKEFPNRQINGSRVKNHSQLIEYLCMKHEKIRKGTLSFVETATAKNIVLYMLSEDYD